ncbi:MULTISPECIES: alpha/beta hydrolase-fold protein [unclassified Streptomyces]|uniref:alpha/beta hydrolase n=1 Tax=unclassified Streptomyces TaxID=2593676 RepID=UPI002E0D78DB|nr:esterase family protein [Streptomyces sp. NBC_01197]WSS52413.1 esterase family protein [Streptomyces sp. NBC_01180]
MSLTGTPFFVTATLVAALAVTVPLFLWHKVHGPVVVRGAVRFAMVLVAQAAAIVVVFVAVNNANGLYDNWGDLLGTASHVGAAPDLGDDGTGGRSVSREPRVKQTFTPVDDSRMGAGVRVTHLTGRVSGADGEVYVWLPPQYSDPAFKAKDFPVVEILPGYPGSAKDWFTNLDVNRQLQPLMAKGEVKPFILVAPRTSLLGGEDTGCANVPGVVDADTWLSVDVRKMVSDNFRAETGAGGWGVAGISAGAHCAAKLAIEHPGRYRAGVALSGYNDPAAESDSVTAGDPVLRRETNPLWILTHAGHPPRTSLFLTGQHGDGYEDGLALRKAAKAPTKVWVQRTHGGHLNVVWKPLLPEVFRWLSGRLSGVQDTRGGLRAGGGSGGGAAVQAPGSQMPPLRHQRRHP